jgi:hypothetical protein
LITEFLSVIFENGTQQLGNREDELGRTNLFEDMGIEPLGEKQDALLLARGIKKPAFTGIRLNLPVSWWV